MIPRDIQLKIHFQLEINHLTMLYKRKLFFFQGSGADMDAPHSHIFKCPRCGGSGKEKLKAGPISTSATCIKCEGRGTFVTAICKFVRKTHHVHEYS